MQKIYEYQEVEYNDLREHILDTPSLHKYFKQDWNKLRSRQYCGILNFNNTDYYLLPKISNSESANLNIFIYMLMYTYNIKLTNEQIASCENQRNTILEVFVQMFARNLLNELKKGVYKEYITEQDNLTTLRGKYLINENLKYNFTKNKIYCEYDEFSENNGLNQFFLFTIKYLQKFVKDKKLLKQCELVFDEVEYFYVDIKNLNIHFNRMNYRFKASFEVALLLLEKSTPLFANGKKSFAFLFDMNVLFEKFVAKIVQENYEAVEIPKSYIEFGDLKLKPDIIVNSKRLIIDCKYKKIDTKKIDRNDKYQMYAYGNNFDDIERTMLLYPKNLNQENNKELKEEYSLGKNDKKIEMRIKKIDLDFDGCYENYLKEIERRIVL